MGACANITVLSGVQYPRVLGGASNAIEEYLVTLNPGSASTDYATGGQTFALPSDVKGAEVDSITVVAVTPINARTWRWDGSRTAPKLVAFDGFVTEEGNGTTVNTDTLTCLVRVRR